MVDKYISGYTSHLVVPGGKTSSVSRKVMTDRPSPTWDTCAPVGCLSGPPLLTNAHACAFSDDEAAGKSETLGEKGGSH